MGLSPLARGKLAALTLPYVSPGPIPAGAGETHRTPDDDSGSRAYPRWRGGNLRRFALILVHQGLSPLARGKPSRAALPVILRGPIPAGAGETPRAAISQWQVGAYPRWRGGNSVVLGKRRGRRGLSPLARGKRQSRLYRRQGRGPIPAGAGETCTGYDDVPESRAYPRWRGGNEKIGEARRVTQGLSPLARGKLVYPKLDTCTLGLSPLARGKLL